METLPEEEQPAGAVLVRIQTPVIEIELVVVGLEAQRMRGAVPEICLFLFCCTGKGQIRFLNCM